MNFSKALSHERIPAGVLCAFILSAVAIPRLLVFAPVALALFCYAVIKMRGQPWPMPSLSHFLWSLLFPVLMLISSLWAYDGAAALERALKTAPIFLSLPFLLAGFSAVDINDRVWLQRFFPVAVFFAAAYTALDVLSGGALYKLLRGIDFAEPLNLSQLNRGMVVLTFFSLIAIGILYLQKRWRLLIALIVLSLVCIFASQSQSAQLGFIIGLAAIFLFPARFHPAWYGAGGLIAAGVLGAPWIVHFFYGHFINSTVLLTVRQAYMPERVEIWHFITQRALESPWVGYGADSTRYMQFDTARIFVSGDTAMHPHNFAIQLWIEFGFMGAALGVLCLLAILRGIRAIKDPLAQNAALGPFFAALSIAATSYGLWQGWFLGLLLLTQGLTALLVHNSGNKPTI